LVSKLLDQSLLWTQVFEAMHIPLNEGEDAELEFRKAYYKLKFDRVWNSEI